MRLSAKTVSFSFRIRLLFTWRVTYDLVIWESSAAIRPPLNKKSFPVHRPGGIILRLYPAAFFFFFFFFFKLKYFSYFSSDFQTAFTIVYRMIRRMHKKKNISKKKSISRPPGWFYFTPPGPQETIFYLRVA